MRHVNGYSLNSRKTQQWAVFSVAVFFIFVGVPIWWKTTDVYRAYLPYSQVSKLLNEKTFTVTLLVEVIHDESLNATHISSSLQNLLNTDQNIGSSNAKTKHIIFKYDVSVSSNDEFTAGLDSIKVLFRTSIDKMSSSFDINVNDHSAETIVCLIPEDVKDVVIIDALKAISLHIKDNLVNENTNEGVVQNIFESSPIKQGNTRNVNKMFSTSSSIELLFSLLVPVSERGITDWNIKESIHEYLSPFLRRLLPAYNFKIGSQILFANTVSFHTTKRKYENSGTVYTALKENQLSSVVNSIESRLGSQLSSDPTINFVMYVVEERHRPLYLVKSPDNVSQSNVFLVPRWGSMSFFNPPHLNHSSVVNSNLDVFSVMPSFIAHLRVLLGLNNDAVFKEKSQSNINYKNPTKYGISDWECQFLFRLRTLENMAKTQHTLDSLFQLLNRIHNIVINDNVAREIFQSVHSINDAKQFMEKGNLMAALNSSRIAFSSSENAFFDPSLLELLYFPQDQKFAIYIPLFVPIGLPIVLSVALALKRCFATTNQNAKLKDE